MLKVGIVGIKNSEKYIQVLETLKMYSLFGIYDPVFQINTVHAPSIKEIKTDFNCLLKNCDLLIFPNPNASFLPLITEAIYHSKAILLDHIKNYTYIQLSNIAKLVIEAKTTIRVLHSDLSHEVFEHYIKNYTQPLVIESKVSILKTQDLLTNMIEEVACCLSLVKSNVRKVKTHFATANSEIPDVYYVNLEFDNACFANILLTALGSKESKKIEVIGLNAQYKLNFNNLNYKKTTNGKTRTYQFEQKNNTLRIATAKQLEKFYYSIINGEQDYYPLEIEINTLKIIEKITEKLKVCSNLV